jgi:hypothetical protein
MLRRVASTGLSVSCVLWLACGSDKEAARQAAAVAAFEAAAHSDPDLADPLGRAIVELAQQDAAGWVKAGKLFRGTLPARGRQSFLVVLPYGHCYRFLGVSEAMSDLDLLLFDDAGVELQRDVTQSPTAMLGASAALCPQEPLELRIEARARHGDGPFAIGLFHDP